MFQIEDIAMAVGLVLLLLCAVVDGRTHQIPVWLLVAGSLSGGFWFLYRGMEQWYLYLAGAVVGALFLLLGKITREAIGYGDGWILCNLGAFLGIGRFLEVLAISWILLAGVAMVCMVRKRWSRKASLPLVPFLTVGYICVFVESVINK